MVFETNLRNIVIPNRWSVHSYYTISPYAPDGSQRLLLAGADLESNTGEVFVLSRNGEITDCFGRNELNTGFYHTGFWQTWSPDARYVYFQGGTLTNPKIVRRDLNTGNEKVIEGDMEGAPPFGEPIYSGLMGMLYAAGYGDGLYKRSMAPVAFMDRGNHGLFQFDFKETNNKLLMSIEEMLDKHPLKNQIFKAEKEIKTRLGNKEGLTLMIYCVRWNSDGSRFLFYFGNHCVSSSRREPRLSYVFTASKDLKEIHMALDLSFGKPGVHWSWHPDGEHLIGYGPDPQDSTKMCLAQVHYDGEDYKKIFDHSSGGHPSISPVDHDLLVTDTGGQPGEVLFINVKEQRIVKRIFLPRQNGKEVPTGRNRLRVCHHPVFNRDGSKVLVNILEESLSSVCEIQLGGSL
jgi:hypothetical protein